MRRDLQLTVQAAFLVGSLFIVHSATAGETGPSCSTVQASFQSGTFDNREAIVDGLQDHLKAAGADKPLGRDGKVQAIIMAVLRCQSLGHGDFIRALDQTVAQVMLERLKKHSPD